MSETALDHWVVSHYNGMTLDKIPPNKPYDMSKEVHTMIKKQFFQKAMKGKKKKQKVDRSSPDAESIKTLSMGQYRYMLAPTPEYRHGTYAKDN